MKKGPRGAPSHHCGMSAQQPAQAALSQAAVSKALLIKGMFMPKLGLVPLLGTALAAGLATMLFWAVSAARSHDPISGERATEKNRNT